MMKEFIVDEFLEERLDLYLSKKLPEMSRSQIKKLVATNVSVNGKTEKPKYKVQLGDKILFEIPQKSDPLEKIDLDLDIRYEDSDLAILFKPKGLIVHPSASTPKPTLVNGLLYSFHELSTLSGEDRPGIVHRLDKDTSGLLVIAKNDKMHLKLQKLFQEREIKKNYYALCYGRFKEKKGQIHDAIGRHPVRRTEMVVHGENAREAISNYEVVWENEAYSLVKISIITGRTHQNRVHMKHIHHPIVGDPIYGLKKDRIVTSGELLSACGLGFIHPERNEEISIQAKPDSEFLDILDRINCKYFTI